MTKTKSIIYDDHEWEHKTHMCCEGPDKCATCRGHLVDGSLPPYARCVTSLVKKPSKNWKGEK